MVKFIKWFLHCILVPREYFLVDGELYVREWFNPPVSIGEALKEHYTDEEIKKMLE